MWLRRTQGSVSPALERPKHYYRAIGRPTVDPELMLRMLWTSRPRSDHLHSENADAGKGHARDRATIGTGAIK